MQLAATLSVPSSNHLIETSPGHERGVLHRRVGLDPIDAPADLAPEPLRIGDRALVEASGRLFMSIQARSAHSPGTGCSFPDIGVLPRLFVVAAIMSARAGDRNLALGRIPACAASASEPAEDRALQQQDTQPMTSVNQGQRRFGAAEGVVDGHRGYHEAEPHEGAGDGTAAQGYSPRRPRWRRTPASTQAMTTSPTKLMMNGVGLGVSPFTSLARLAASFQPRAGKQHAVPQPPEHEAHDRSQHDRVDSSFRRNAWHSSRGVRRAGRLADARRCVVRV